MDFINSVISPLFRPDVWKNVSTGLWALFLFIVVRILWLLLWHREPVKKKKKSKLSPYQAQFRRVLWALFLLFAAVLGHQATWQLAGQFGHTHTRFVEFMMRYDRRQFNPAHQIERGRILDRNGVVLALSEEKDGQMIRRYPLGPACAHLVGYSNPEMGMAGLESAAQAQLIGVRPGLLENLKAFKKSFFQKDRQFKGDDLKLTLDARLQLYAYRLLEENNYRGAIVVMDVRDGGLLTLVSNPGFDPNHLSREIFSADSRAAPLLNRATLGLYPPGSTFKIAVSAIALEAGFRGTLNCPADGYTTSPRYKKIRDHAYYDYQKAGREWPGYGEIDMPTALRESSNVFYAQLGVMLGTDLFEALSRRFYFNKPITIFENAGRRLQLAPGQLLVSANQNPYDLAQMAIGQGRLLVTPAHLCLIAAAVAHQGLMVKPRLEASDAPEALIRCMPEDVADRVAGMMRDVVTSGTARGINMNDLPVAGKTGTAENPRGAPHSWFIGFAPYPEPRVAFSVLVEHGGYGSQAAVPTARRLLIQAKRLGLLDPLDSTAAGEQLEQPQTQPEENP